ncbi:Dyp-type peroxidase [Nostoc sp. C110]|uniref:Dyp-type peroxidase n=1 Tax=Nostoc sp. C110 TaxID=3349876 RepID=UPI00370D88CE
MTDLKLSDSQFPDIQGLILNTYKMPLVRHFVLQIINSADAAKDFIGNLVNGNSASSLQITTASSSNIKPDYCLNIGFTYEGLKALKLRDDSLSSFPKEFIQGSAARAEKVGDTGASAPENWKGKLGTPEAHILLTLFAQSSHVLESVTMTLRALFTQQNALTELSHHDGNALPDGRTHFGFKDGFSQPTIEGGPPPDFASPLPPAPAGEFLLGYPSQHPGFTFPIPTPHELGFNGSFVAFRILQQDVDGFEKFLQENASKIGMSVEKLAAKVCGRWRNGVPLVLSPETDEPQIPIAPNQMNNFDYVSSSDDRHNFDDKRGDRCPIGAHIRRTNPRSEKVAGNGGHLHRLVRRGLSYGPPYDPAVPNDDIERGTLGMFICVSLLDQFEFIMTQWVNDGIFTAGLDRTKDPMIGNNTPEESKFVIPTEEGAKTIKGFSQFVTTRGGAYCFLPSITALKYIASLQSVLI